MLSSKAMTSPEHEFFKPQVDWKLYTPEWVLLVCAYVTPFIAFFVWHHGVALQRSGGVMVFFAVAAEFITINRANKKHMLNASRAARHEQIWDFSTPGKIVGWQALGVALVGTILWVFGDLMLPNGCIPNVCP